ncbi:hypothetical protein BGW42_002105 [Actinomortierella wolfii]|nr:hypothetical protein BGW42_002105 [Actinomortierella wolfii]
MSEKHTESRSTSDGNKPILCYRSSRWPARLLAATGAFHNFVGLLIPELRNPLISGIKAGFFNQFGKTYAKSSAFWFFFAGLQMIMTAHVMNIYLFPKDRSRSSKRVTAAAYSDRKLPRSIGAWLVGLGSVGIIAIPASGFYLVVSQGAALLLAA